MSCTHTSTSPRVLWMPHQKSPAWAPKSTPDLTQPSTHCPAPTPAPHHACCGCHVTKVQLGRQQVLLTSHNPIRTVSCTHTIQECPITLVALHLTMHAVDAMLPPAVVVTPAYVPKAQLGRQQRKKDS
eukprot:747398-Pelagomonas_calceolata.AAC.2